MAKSAWKPIRKSRSVRQAENRDVVGYSLRDAKDRRVYTGITNNARAKPNTKLMARNGQVPACGVRVRQPFCSTKPQSAV